jgi:hypothetical protein
LIKSYLNERFQTVLTDDKIAHNKVSYSTWEEVKSGVPRGSILGSLLFLPFINNFPKTATKSANRVLFADDTSVIVTNSNDTLGWDSSVGIATGYKLECPAIKSRWRRNFSHTSILAPGPTQPPVQWVLGLFWG